MNPFRTMLRWLGSLGKRRTIKHEIDEELRFHIEMRTQENIAAGMSPEEAARAARKRFGNVQTVREECRDVKGTNFGETLVQDVRFGARMLRKNPGFTAVAILTLALGIGANTAIFSFINAILLQPLPYREPEELVTSRWDQNVNTADFFKWRDCRALTNVAIYRFVFYSMPGDPFPERVKGVRCTSTLLSTFKVHPFLGRDLRPEEDFRGAQRVIMLGHDLWKRRFRGDTNVVGKGVSIGGDAFTVVGVAPPGFNFPEGAEFWTPVEFPAEAVARVTRSGGNRAIARLAPGVTLEEANAQLAVIDARKESAGPNSVRAISNLVIPLHEDTVGRMRPALMLLLGAVGLVLLVACANVANLLLARSVTRQKEIAVRCALGAGQGRIFQQLLAESIFLSLLGGLAGIFLAVWLSKFFLLLAPSTIPRLQEVRIDSAVLAFSLLVSVFCGILFGLFPAFQAARVNLLKTLNDGGKGSRSAGHHRARSVLVVAEIAIAVVLLSGAGLLVQSLARLQRVELGFNPKNVMLVPMAGECSFRWNLLERMRSIPGDISVGVVDFVPCIMRPFTGAFWKEGETPGTARFVRGNLCSAGYFKAMGIPVLKGREFERYEHRGTDGVMSNAVRTAVVNDILVKRYFPKEDPIGKQMFFNIPEGIRALTIVGVVKPNRYFMSVEPDPEFFTLFPQNCGGTRPLTLVVRSHWDAKTVMAAIRKEAHAVDPTLSVGDGITMENQMALTLAQRKFQMKLLAGLALTGLLLSAIGIYGVLAYAVTQRTQEIGIRMAMGAQRSDVLWLVLRQGLKLALLGVVIGVIAALGLSRFIKSFLFEVTPTDPLTFICVVVLLLAIAVLACWLPARRATRVDPMVALRYE